MGKWRKKLKKWLSKQGEDWKFAGQGILLATRTREFWVGFVITFTIFGTLMNLLSGGFAAFNLMGAVGFSGSLKIIWDAFLQNFGFGRQFIDWLGIFAMTVLQSLIIGLLVLVLKKQKRDSLKHRRVRDKQERDAEKQEQNHEHLQNSGIVAGLALLGSGCPTCGTALLTPVLGAFFSTGGVAVAAKISGIITVLAVLLAIWTLKKLGVDVYVIIVCNKSKEKNGKRN